MAMFPVMARANRGRIDNALALLRQGGAAKPQAFPPPVFTGERCLTENVAAAVQAAARRAGGA
jgi:hypothetical protein